MTETLDKSAARRAGFARRKVAHDTRAVDTAAHLSALLAGYRGVPIAGFLPIRTEIDPTPAMAQAARHGPVGVPVIMGADQPLHFACWTPGTELIAGEFGVMIPDRPVWMVPELVILPLLAFTGQGGRLGYGGGFYDRTLERLRADGPILAIGFAFAAQQDDALPLEPTDQRLDMIVTERGVVDFRA